MSTAESTSTTFSERLLMAGRGLLDRIGYVAVAGASAFIVWWVVAEAVTADGVDVWCAWTGWQWTGFVAALAGPALLTAWTGPGLRRSWARRIKPDGETVSLKWLVAIGFVVTLILAVVMFYAQAELLTAPGESAWLLDSSELLDISRSTAFSLGAIGAIAALLVGYRRQKSTEDAHRHEVATTASNLEFERIKQEAEKISNLHDRYAKAVEQLASDNPTIRLGGVYVLSALANDWLIVQDYRQRQICVDMLCAYLRSVPEIATDIAEDHRDEQFLALPKKDQDARKAALEALSDIRTLEVEGGDETTRGPVQELYRTLTVDGPIPLARIDLRGVTLRGLDLRHARLAYLSLVGADLSGANLEDADLTEVDLTNSTMDDVILRQAMLNRTNLTGANLERVDLTEAIIIHANLKVATITTAESVFSGTLFCAILIGVRISEAWLVELQGVGVVMDQITLNDASPNMSGILSADPGMQQLMHDKREFNRVSRLIDCRDLEMNTTVEELMLAASLRINYSWEDGEAQESA